MGGAPGRRARRGGGQSRRAVRPARARRHGDLRASRARVVAHAAACARVAVVVRDGSALPPAHAPLSRRGSPARRRSALAGARRESRAPRRGGSARRRARAALPRIVVRVRGRGAGRAASRARRGGRLGRRPRGAARGAGARRAAPRRDPRRCRRRAAPSSVRRCSQRRHWPRRRAGPWHHCSPLPRRTPCRTSARTRVDGDAASLCGTLVLLAARVAVLGTIGGDVPHPYFRALSPLARIGVGLANLPRTAAMLLLPIQPAIEEVPPLAAAWHPSVALLCVGAALLLAGARARRAAPPPAERTHLGACLLAATIAPTSNLHLRRRALTARTLYAPSIGAALMAGWRSCVARVTRRPLACSRPASRWCASRARWWMRARCASGTTRRA